MISCHKMIKRLLKYILVKLKSGHKCKISITADVSPSSTFEGMSKIYPYSRFTGHLGYGSYIGDHSKLEAYIGRFTCIGPRVSTNLGLHPYKPPFAAMAPCFYSLGKQNGNTFATEQLYSEWHTFEGKKYGVEIGSDCWIGEGVFITGGVHVCDGAVLLAHAVVTKDVPPYAIVGGVPAKVLNYRYDESTIQFLLKFKWWNHDVKWLQEHWELLNDLEKLKRYTNE